MSTGPTLAPDPSDLSDTMRHYWDGVAEGYARSEVFNSTPGQRAVWSHLLRRLFPPSAPLEIVDIGCGSGFLALALAELGHRVTGLDISPEMLRYAEATARERGLSNLTLLEGAAEAPPVGLGPVDAVVSRHVLWTLPQPEVAVRAWTDLVRPGGRVVGIDSLWSAELVADMDGDFGYPPEVTRLLPLLHAQDPEPAANVWRRGGLSAVMTERLAWIDQALRADARPEAAPMLRELTFYLVEGTRPDNVQSPVGPAK